MRRYLAFAGALLAFFTAGYLLVSAASVAVLTDPGPTLDRLGAWAGALGVGLLVADAFIPVASSVVMISLGALYGPLAGAALSLIGRLGGWLAGFALGRKSEVLLERIAPEHERARAERLLARHGAIAVVLTRPAPLLGETVAVLAGASRMSWTKGTLAAVVGSIPEAVTYTLAGALARSFDTGAVIWLLFLVVAGAFWFAAAWIERRQRGADQPRVSKVSGT